MSIYWFHYFAKDVNSLFHKSVRMFIGNLNQVDLPTHNRIDDFVAAVDK